MTDVAEQVDVEPTYTDEEIEGIEETFVGAILRNERNAAIGMRHIKPDYFMSTKTRMIAQAIVDVAADGGAIQTHTIIEYLRNTKTANGKALIDIVSREYIHEVALAAPEEGAFDTYWRSIEDRWMRAKIKEFSREAYVGIDDGSLPTAVDAKRYIETQLIQLNDESAEQKSSMLVDSYSDVIDSIIHDVRNKGEIVGIPTGFNGLDSATGGLRGGQLIVLAGTPGSGKTSFAMNAGSAMAIYNDQPVIFFSLEMSDKELTQRIISSESEVPYQRIRDRTMVEKDWLAVSEMYPAFSEAPLNIVYQSDLSFMDVKSYTYQMANEYNKPPVIVIDYLQLMNFDSGQSGFGANRNQQVGDVTRGLKILAGELETPVILLSQLNRNLEYRDNKRPVLNDLRDSGSIGQDADMVLFTYRDGVYFPKSGDQGIAELIIAKHRAGQSGTIKLGFMSQYTKFINLTPFAETQTSVTAGNP